MTTIQENEQGYQLELDVPGIRRETLDVQVENDLVRIKGERPNVGSFQRAFVLPDWVNQTAIQAKLADGVLHLTLPRREESKPKQIQVQVN